MSNGNNLDYARDGIGGRLANKPAAGQLSDGHEAPVYNGSGTTGQPDTIGLERFRDYERGLAAARERMAKSAFAVHLAATPPRDETVSVESSEFGLTEEDVERFLLNFSTLGVAMTEPVEGWIRRAGEACLAHGLDELGSALIKHAKHEADHHLLMVRDSEKLVERRRRRGLVAPDATDLIARPFCVSTVRYRQLHEEVIAGPRPYAQIAIEYEIEQLAAQYGPGLIAQCRRALGPQVDAALGFLIEHATLDIGHTHFNRAQLIRFLARQPDVVDGLIEVGSAALDAYLGFLTHCMSEPLSAVR